MSLAKQVKATACRAVFVAVIYMMSAPSYAAQNCISNGDFETDGNGNVSAYINWGYAKSGNAYSPANWTLNDRNHMGLVNEGTDRHNVLDTLGAHSLAIERYKGTSNLLEAKQSFSIPAPGTYRLTLLYMSWNFDTLTFVRDPADERRYSVVKKDDGVYIVNGLTIIVR